MTAAESNIVALETAEDFYALAPFVDAEKRDYETADYWSVPETGNNRIDWTLGKAMANEFVEFLAEHNEINLLGRVVEAIMKKGRYGKVELAFFETLNEHLASSQG